MKKLIAVLLFMLISTCLTVQMSAEETQQTRYIAVQEGQLKIGLGEAHLKDGPPIVRLEKLLDETFSNLKQSEDGTSLTITKNNKEITYNIKNDTTTVNGVLLQQNPIHVIDGKLYIEIRFLEDLTEQINHQTCVLTRGTTKPIDSSKNNIEENTNIDSSKNNIKEDAKKEPKPPNRKPTVYLTFDDGPNEFTKTNLNTLSKYNIKGTFFFVGKQVNYFPDIVKQTANEGHSLGLHGMTHDRAKVYASSKTFIGEMNEEKTLIQKLTGTSTNIVRAPYGSSPYVTQGMRSELKTADYKLWDWDVDSNDWRYTIAEYKKIIHNVKDGVNKANKAKDQHIVILLHDRAQTAKALPEIITWLQKEGYNIQAYDPTNHIVQNFLKDNAL